MLWGHSVVSFALAASACKTGLPSQGELSGPENTLACEGLLILLG